MTFRVRGRTALAATWKSRSRGSASVTLPSQTSRSPLRDRYASPGQIRPSQLITFLRQKLRQFLDINIHQVNRRDFAGMGSDAHDKILADSIDDKEAVVVTADREPTGMT